MIEGARGYLQTFISQINIPSLCARFKRWYIRFDNCTRPTICKDLLGAFAYLKAVTEGRVSCGFFLNLDVMSKECERLKELEKFIEDHSIYESNFELLKNKLNEEISICRTQSPINIIYLDNLLQTKGKQLRYYEDEKLRKRKANLKNQNCPTEFAEFIENFEADITYGLTGAGC